MSDEETKAFPLPRITGNTNFVSFPFLLLAKFFESVRNIAPFIFSIYAAA